MSQQDKLRRSLREYYDSQQFKPGENEWEKATILLQSAKQARRIRLAVFVVAAILSASCILYLQSPKYTIDETGRSLSHSAPNKIPASVELVVHALQNTTTSVQSFKKDHGVTMPEHPAVVQGLKPTKPAKKIKAPAQAPDALVRKNIAPENAGTVGSYEPDADPDAMNTKPADQEPGPKAVATNNGIKHITSGSGIPDISPAPAQNEKAVVEAPSNTNRDPDSSEEQAKFDTASNKIKSEPLTEQILIQTQVAAPLANLKDSADKVLDPEPSFKNEIVASDSSPVSAPLPRFAGEGIFYEAGLAWHYGWKIPGGYDARSLSPLAGINYMNRFANNYAFSFGIQYLQVGKLSKSSKTSRESVYRYGEQSRVTVITPATIHYLVAPLRFHYFLNNHNCFGGGVNLAYLLSVDAKVTSYDEKPGSQTNFKTVKLSGYTEGFLWFDSQLSLFYRRNICASLGLQAEVFFGLTDVKDDGFFGVGNKDRNSGAKLTLIYYAFRKHGK